jgi:chaperonin GroES
MLKPLEDKVIVKPRKENEKKTNSGFILSSSEEKPQDGVVIAVGPGMTFGNGTKLDIDLRPGDVVAYAKYQGTEIEHDGEDYLILAYRDIIAVIEESND